MQFQEIKIDLQGRPLEIKDHWGLQQTIRYTESGEISVVTEKRDGKNYGFAIDRNEQGRIQKVNSSWGSEEFQYDVDGNLGRVNLERYGKTAAIEYESGLVKKVKQFDGEEATYTYYDDKTHAGLLKEVTCPDGTPLKYDYDEADRLSRVSVGEQSHVVLDYDQQGRLVGYGWQLADSIKWGGK